MLPISAAMQLESGEVRTQICNHIFAAAPASGLEPSFSCSDRARAETGDACDIASKHQGAAGIVSLFGLQQLPEAHLALANWVEALAPGAFSNSHK